MTKDELITEFSGYIRDICSQPPSEQGNRLETVLARFADSSVRLAAQTLIPLETDFTKLTDDELADHMQHHITSRDGARLQNGAWMLMLEAAARLRRNAQMRVALEFYADPNAYFAIGFLPDSPCGDFINDFSEVADPNYRRVMPGARARAALGRDPSDDAPKDQS